MMLRATLSLVVLHLLTAAPLPWESAPRPQAWWQLSPDLLGLLLLAVVLGRTSWPRVAAALLALLTCLVPAYRFGETLMPTFYGKPFEPWVDLLEVPGLVHLLTHAHTAPVQVAMYVGACGAATLVLWMCLRLWSVVLRAAARPRATLALLFTVQALLAAAFALREVALPVGGVLRPSMGIALLEDLRATLATPRWRGDDVVHERVRAASAELQQLPQQLGGLAGADVFLLIVESYGRGVLGTQARAEFTAELAAREAALTRAGWCSASGWLAPSVRGGGSSLAHAELLSGIAVEDRRVFDHLLASDVRTLAAVARDAGYHSVDVQPAMPREWPEAKALGFVQDLFQSRFAYTGHAYPWGLMPDQFALQHVLTHVVRPRSRPLFVQYVGVSSHAPFNAVPPYLEDWARAADAAAFAQPAASWDITWTTYADHPQVRDAYLASIRYALRVAFDFALQLRDPAVVVVVGDHQPPLPYEDEPSRLHDVPLHIVSNRPELVEPWFGLGLQAGLTPAADGASFPGARFLARFLRAYGR